MRKTGGYTEADFLRVERAQNKPERRKTEDLEPRQEVRSRQELRYRPDVSSRQAGQAVTEQVGVEQEAVWTEADFLPSGWMEKQGTFMSPVGDIFFSVQEVGSKGTSWTIPIYFMYNTYILHVQYIFHEQYILQTYFMYNTYFIHTSCTINISYILQ